MASNDNSSAIRIVMQNGEHWMRNIGDLAMLSVTLRRLRGRWPSASLHVMTSAPALLRAYHPDVRPISDGRLPGWVAAPLSAAGGRLGLTVAGSGSMGALRARERLSGLVDRLRGGPAAAAPVDEAPGVETWEAAQTDVGNRPAVEAALDGAALVLAIGGGYVNDLDPWQFHRTLDLLQHAIDRGTPTAMVGQGLGPLTDQSLLARAGKVLPSVDLIALREDRAGPGLLAGLGVAPERVLVTGDDAIELAHELRREAMGSDLGVCLRAAAYSPVAARAQDAVGRAVRAAAGALGARLAPLVVSEVGAEDRRSTLPLVAGFDRVAPVQGRFVTPQEVVMRVGRCRVVVTGAYHLAVFALAQGIPVVGLSSSRYYDDKLLGLDAMFGGRGLQLVRLDEENLEHRVAAGARAAWERAPVVRPALRQRASAQVAASTQAFERVFSLVEQPRMP